MALLVIAIIWIAISAFLVLYLGRTPKGRAWAGLIWHYHRTRPVLLAFAVFVALIVAAYALYPRGAFESTLDSRQVFVDYSKAMVEKLVAENYLSRDSSCDLESPMPELSYNLPALLKIYNEEVRRPTLPRLVRLDDTLWLSFDGYKQFKNRGIRIVKKVQQRLGPRYLVKIDSKGEKHRLELVYRGTPWSIEQLCGLPAMEASVRENVDPALLMSIIRHVSNFDLGYRGPRGEGLLALDSGTGLSQIYTGASLLAAYLQQEKTVEDAVAQLYPVRERGSLHEEWRNNPLKQSWIEEVLKDVPYYRNNGLVRDSAAVTNQEDATPDGDAETLEEGED